MQWGDIDFQKGIINIRRNAVYSSLLGLCVGEPKTKSGERIIPVAKYTIDVLKQYRSLSAAKHRVDNDMYLFSAKDDPYKPQNPMYITTHMKRFIKQIGLPNMSPHDLRHTCASIMLQNGADVKSMQDILGHASASTTLNFYVCSDLDSMRRAVEGIFGETIN